VSSSVRSDFPLSIDVRALRYGTDATPSSPTTTTSAINPLRMRRLISVLNVQWLSKQLDSQRRFIGRHGRYIGARLPSTFPR
jgi:hypothetical protein